MLISMACIFSSCRNKTRLIFEGQKFDINIGIIGINQDGNMFVEILGNFNVKSKINTYDAVELVLKMMNVHVFINGTQYEAEGLAFGTGEISLKFNPEKGTTARLPNLIFIFKTNEMPDKIIVSNDKSTLTFDGTTKKHIK